MKLSERQRGLLVLAAKHSADNPLPLRLLDDEWRTADALSRLGLATRVGALVRITPSGRALADKLMEES